MELTQQQQFTQKRIAAIAVLFIGAVAARIFWISQMRGLWGDEPFYTWLGASFTPANAVSFSNSHASPLFSAIAGIVSAVLGFFGLTGAPAIAVSTLFIYVVSGGLLVAPVYGIARRMGNEATAAGAGLATMFYPAMLGGFPHADVMVEPVYLLLVAGAWYFLLLAVDAGQLWPAALGGLLVGLAYLSRTEALFYLAVALGLLLLATWLSRKQSFAPRRVVSNAAIALGMFVLIAGPYLIPLTQLPM
jgi:hypothetical protein